MQQPLEAFGPVARTLLACWRQLPARDCVPDRRSFDPMEVARILPVISVLEHSAEGDAWQFRVAGSEIERRWQCKLTGLDYFTIDIVSPHAADMLRREFREIAERPCGSFSRRLVEFHSGRQAIIETLRLPLRGNDGRINLILSCTEELRGADPPPVDGPREIIRLVEQRFFDIGAGCPAESVIPAGATTENPPGSTS